MVSERARQARGGNCCAAFGFGRGLSGFAWLSGYAEASPRQGPRQAGGARYDDLSTDFAFSVILNLIQNLVFKSINRKG